MWWMGEHTVLGIRNGNEMEVRKNGGWIDILYYMAGGAEVI